MAIDHQTINVSTTPIRIAEAEDGVQKVMVYVFNNDASANMWVGDASVSSNGSGPDLGYKVPKDTGTVFEIYGGEELYAVSTTNIRVSIMTTGNKP
jgi:hypothetical protein